MAGNIGEQQVAAHLKLNILQEQRDHLVKNLIPDRHTDFLRSKYVLSEDDCDEINAQISRRKRASKFLDILLTKGPDAYDAFCKALEIDGTQMFLLESLNRDFENRIKNFRDLMHPNNRPVIKIISPPNLRPPPPGTHQPQSGKSLDPVEHQYIKADTPPASPDFLKNTGCSTTSVSSAPTALTDLSANIHPSSAPTALTDLSTNIHPLAHTSTTGASGINPLVHAATGTTQSNDGSIHKGGNVSFPQQESNSEGRPAETGGGGCSKTVYVMEILRSIGSSGSHPASSACSRRMHDFCSFTSSFPSSSSMTSSFPSSSSASSSPSIISGISKSDKSTHAPKLFSRGGSEEDAVVLPHIHGQPQSAFVSSMSIACHVQNCVLKNHSGSAETRLSDADPLQSPSSENEKSGEFFSSLLQSWVDMSTGSDTSCDDHRKGKILLQQYVDYPHSLPEQSSHEMCSVPAQLNALTVQEEHASQENATEELMLNSADEKEKCTSRENNLLPKTVLEILCVGSVNADDVSKLHINLSDTRQSETESGAAFSRMEEKSCESESYSAPDGAEQSQSIQASVESAQTAASKVFVVDNSDKNPGNRTSSHC